MKSIFASLLFLSLVLSACAENPLRIFLERETDEQLVADAKKDSTFFLRIVIGGWPALESASYEVTWSGNTDELQLLPPIQEIAAVVRRDESSESRVTIDSWELVNLISFCIGQELFNLGVDSKSPSDPQWIGLDSGSSVLKVFIKFRDAEATFGRTDKSIPVFQTYNYLSKLVREKTAQLPPERS